MPRYRVAAISDVHAPLTCPKLWKQAMALVADHKPDVFVMNGDWMEGKFQSRHCPDERHKWTVFDEFEAVAEQAEDIRKAAPGALKVWVVGNHDSNLLEYNTGRRDKETVQLLQSAFEKYLRGPLDGWKTKPYRHNSTWCIGQLCFRHGCDTAKSAIAKDLADYTPYNGLLVLGHTHRPQAVTQHVHGDVRYPWWHCNLGTLADPKRMHYVDRMRTTQWGAAVLLAEVDAPGLREGRKIYEKPNWKARVEILSMGSHNHHDVSL